MPSLTAAQSNWALLPGPDSLVATPLGHLREVAAFRIVRDVQVSKYRAETIERVNAAVNWQNALSKSDSIAKVNTEKLDLCDERLTIVQKQADRVPKLLPWARVGKWGTVAVGLTTLWVVYQELKP
ncbi:MAG TPA: hypothetical protein PLE71_17905 [Flavobacteriales bacterium]|nr:hypothetical protein [Flavobacteriales bacterium]